MSLGLMETLRVWKMEKGGWFLVKAYLLSSNLPRSTTFTILEMTLMMDG